MYILKSVLISIVLSLLLFFSVCFTQVIISIWIDGRPLDLGIGFPFTFYNQFQVDSLDLRTGTNGLYLLYDAIIFFVLTLIGVLLYRKRKAD